MLRQKMYLGTSRYDRVSTVLDLKRIYNSHCRLRIVVALEFVYKTVNDTLIVLGGKYHMPPD